MHGQAWRGVKADADFVIINIVNFQTELNAQNIQPRPVQQVQHEPQIITVQDTQGNRMQQMVYQVHFYFMTE